MMNVMKTLNFGKRSKKISKGPRERQDLIKRKGMKKPIFRIRDSEFQLTETEIKLGALIRTEMNPVPNTTSQLQKF